MLSRMIKSNAILAVLISIWSLLSCSCLCGAGKAVEPKGIEIVSSPIAEDCYTKRDDVREVDTIVVHYVSSIYWFNEDLQDKLPDEGKEYAEKVGPD